ncbi:MAG: molybdopterin biosynthesis protein [delta proteobacterium ML8_F1]|nr:MAG: molybdopterin biosynthesis protein [delta proteobacterium ML8_F1]
MTITQGPINLDQWMKEAKTDPAASQVGMFLLHNGVVRETPRVLAREGLDDGSKVRGMTFSYDAEKVNQAISETSAMEGILYIKVWLNSGRLEVGEDIMYVLVGGDIRPHVIDGLQFLVEKIKTQCVVEIEHKQQRI